MIFFEEYDSDLDDTEDMPIESDQYEEEEETDDDFEYGDDEEFEVDLDDLNDTLSQLGDDDLDFGDEDDFDDEDEDDGFDSDVLDAISDDDNRSMEDKVDAIPEEELTPDEKKQAADDIAAAVPAMLIKTEMDATEAVNFFSGYDSEVALDEGLLTQEAVEFFMDEIRNMDEDVTTEASAYPAGNKTIVRFSKQALLARIKGICIVKCARAHRDPDIPKYAKACKQRRFFKARMKNKYGREADKQARLIIRRMRQSKSPAIKKLSDKVSGNGTTK